MRNLLACLLLCLPLIAEADDAARFPPEQLEFFEKEVRPLLIERCHKCHGAEQQKGKLRLDSRAAILQGGDSGPAVNLEALANSELLSAISYDPSGYQMPPDGKLPDEQIAVLTRWVEMGVPWPAESAAGGDPVGKTWQEQFDERRKHWSFQPMVRHPLPAVEEAAWCRTPIDRFVAAKRQAAGLTHADETDRLTWLRRIHLDVLGLPPSPEEVEAFIADTAPGAHERVIDRLLSSPHFGERWGRHWLDLVRYAESRGHEFDYDVANPWPYRDYVVRAINGDVPYDRFVVEHVAGDLLERAESPELRVQSRVDDPHPAAALDSGLPALDFSLRLDPATGANESIVATGFWFLGEWVHSPVDIRQEEADRFENMIDVYSKTFLGLTVACARCHDHKFDPIPQTDFYALQGYLQSSVYQQVRYEHWENNQDVTDQLRQLEVEAATKLLPVFQALTLPTIKDLKQYLLAVDDVFKAMLGQANNTTNTMTEADRIRQFAVIRGLDPNRLGHWCAHLRQAANDPHDPFHVWALLATGKIADVAAARVTHIEDAPAERSLSSLNGWLIEATFEQRLLTAERFQSDGIAYRLVPLHPAQIDLGSLPERPLKRTSDGGYIEFDSDLGELPVAPQTMHDGGKLGSLERGGRTLRSPSFEIQHDKVYCEIRGGCHTYVVVDSHALINGPLHGSLLADHPAPKEKPETWRWISHDVARYRGHRAHLEFVPRRGESFALRQAVLADSIPRDAGASRYTALRPINLPQDGDRERLAQTYHISWLFMLPPDWFVAPNRPIGHSSHAAEWVRQHPDLFGLNTDAARQRFAEFSQPLIERRNALLAQLHRDSGLAPVMLDGSGEDEYVFIRGNWRKRGETVPRRFLSAFGGVESRRLSTLGSSTGSGRLDLAKQMVDPQQAPIVARVIVNRIWQHYFGRGLVPTPDDFGHLGTPPTHPELLDWLATELVAHDWSLKHIHRLILESATYRMASELRVEGTTEDTEGHGTSRSTTHRSPLTTDPANSLLWHMPIKRLEGEIIRDAIMALSGRLDDETYGRSVPVHLTSFLEGRGRPGESGPVDGRGRRSLYIAVRRNFAEPFFQAFDFPNPHSTIGRRNVSNVPAQALALLNNPMVLEQCRVAADRLLRETPGAATAARVERLYLEVFGRSPSSDELAAATEFVGGLGDPEIKTNDDPQTWADYIHVLVNAKEFVFVR